MLIDLTLKISRADYITDDPKRKIGHVGTHFDVMNKEFLLENIKRTGKIIDISKIQDREVTIEDINVEVKENDFVIFKTDHFKIGYGEKEYQIKSAELSDQLIDFLIAKKVSLIGVDAPGLQKSAKHGEVDQHCADHNIFVVENLCNVDTLYEHVRDKSFTVYCFPLNIQDTSGLSCRVIAEF